MTSIRMTVCTYWDCSLEGKCVIMPLEGAVDIIEAGTIETGTIPFKADADDNPFAGCDIFSLISLFSGIANEDVDSVETLGADAGIEVSATIGILCVSATVGCDMGTLVATDIPMATWSTAGPGSGIPGDFGDEADVFPFGVLGPDSASFLFCCRRARATKMASAGPFAGSLTTLQT